MTMAGAKNDKRLQELADFMQSRKILSLETPDGYKLAMHPDAFEWPQDEPKTTKPGEPEDDEFADDFDSKVPDRMLTPQERARQAIDRAQSIDAQRDNER